MVEAFKNIGFLYYGFIRSKYFYLKLLLINKMTKKGKVKENFTPIDFWGMRVSNTNTSKTLINHFVTSKQGASLDIDSNTGHITCDGKEFGLSEIQSIGCSDWIWGHVRNKLKSANHSGWNMKLFVPAIGIDPASLSLFLSLIGISGICKVYSRNSRYRTDIDYSNGGYIYGEHIRTDYGWNRPTMIHDYDDFNKGCIVPLVHEGTGCYIIDFNNGSSISNDSFKNAAYLGIIMLRELVLDPDLICGLMKNFNNSATSGIETLQDNNPLKEVIPLFLAWNRTYGTYSASAFRALPNNSIHVDNSWSFILPSLISRGNHLHKSLSVEGSSAYVREHYHAIRDAVNSKTKKKTEVKKAVKAFLNSRKKHRREFVGTSQSAVWS